MLENEQKSGSTDQFLKTILSPGFEWEITVTKIAHIVTVHRPKADRQIGLFVLNFACWITQAKLSQCQCGNLKFTKMRACQKDKSVYILFIHIIY